MRIPSLLFVVGLVAFAAMDVGCGDARESGEAPAASETGADRSTSTEADRVASRVAYKVSGMKKTASGAT